MNFSSLEDLSCDSANELVILKGKSGNQDVKIEGFLVNALGSGTYGKVCLFQIKECQEKPDLVEMLVALKFQYLDLTSNFSNSKTENEILEKVSGTTGVSKLLSSNFEHSERLYINNSEGKDNLNIHIFWQVFEYFPQDLYAYWTTLNKTRNFKNDRLDIIRQMLEVVDKIHEQKIVHYDIKLSNFIVKFEETKPIVNIIDFGLAVDTTKNFNQGTNDETYFPPEVRLNKLNGELEIQVNFSMDTYMLGCAISNLLFPPGREDFCNYMKLDQTNLSEFINSTKRKLEGKEQAVLELVFQNMIIPKETERSTISYIITEFETIMKTVNNKQTFECQNKEMSSNESYAHYVQRLIECES